MRLLHSTVSKSCPYNVLIIHLGKNEVGVCAGVNLRERIYQERELGHCNDWNMGSQD